MSGVVQNLDSDLAGQLPRPEQRGVGQDGEGRLVSVDLFLAICKVDTKTGSATGFYIVLDGQPCMMTNHHVIGTRDDAMTTRLTFDYTKHGLNIGMRCHPEKYFWSSPELDATIVAINDGPLKERDITPLEIIADDARQVAVEDIVTIYGHPDGNFREQSVNHVISVQGGASKAEIAYNADTNPGSSGSPVFNSTFHVVALHALGSKSANTGYDIREILNSARMHGFVPSHFRDRLRRGFVADKDLAAYLRPIVMTSFPAVRQTEDHVQELLREAERGKACGCEFRYTNQIDPDHFEDGLLKLSWFDDRCWDVIYMKVDQKGVFSSVEDRELKVHTHFQAQLHAMQEPGGAERAQLAELEF